MERVRAAIRNLPLFWQLLVPFLALMVIFGAFGVFVIARDLASRADNTLEQDLGRRSVDAHALLRDRELFLLESANLAANLEGMAAAVKAGNAQTAARLLQSVMALKPDLRLVAVTDQSGTGLVEFTRTAESTDSSFGKGTNWSSTEFIGSRLNDPDGKKGSGFVDHGGETLLAIAAPICSTPTGCSSVGIAIVGITTTQLVDAASSPGEGETERSNPGVALFDDSERLLASSGVVSTAALANAGDVPVVERVGSAEIMTMHSGYEVQGQRLGTLAVSIPTAPVASTVRGAAIRLAVVVLLAMIGVVVVGAALSRKILRKVSSLLETNRAIGRGDLSARAQVDSEDELGELARGVNQMAEQLEASYQTLELRVAERTEEVQRLLKERTEFFASLSHELRTPLAVILGEVKLMHTRQLDNPNWVRDTAHKLGYTAEQLLGLVNEVLDLARAETGRLEIHPAPLHLPELIEELRPTMDGLARAGDLDLQVRVPARLPKVPADRARLRDVILNLVDNAVKYTPEGGKVELTAAARNGKVEISVSDTGVGIPAEAKPFLFEPFYRVPGVAPQRGRPSSGLGLAMARRLIEAHGGTISVESEPGAGSKFTVRLLRAAKGRPEGTANS